MQLFFTNGKLYQPVLSLGARRTSKKGWCVINTKTQDCISSDYMKLSYDEALKKAEALNDRQ